MSLSLALATPGFALAVADQRAASGMAGGEAFGFQDGAQKLYPIPGGFVAFTGSLKPLPYLLPALRRCRAEDVATIRALVLAKAPAIDAYAEAEREYLAAAELWTVSTAGVHRWHWSTGEDEPVDFMAAGVPLGMSRAELDPLLDAFCATQPATVTATLTAAHTLFATVAQRCEAVGPLVDIGVVEWPDGTPRQWSAFNVTLDQPFDFPAGMRGPYGKQ
jgi:hypothetical protein